jgi:hypothetical protein
MLFALKLKDKKVYAAHAKTRERRNSAFLYIRFKELNRLLCCYPVRNKRVLLPS